MSTKSSLTILFESPFWIGLYEHIDNNKYEVCKITFGAEPKDYEAARKTAMQAHDAFEDTMELIRLRAQAQAIADEIVLTELIYT